MDIIYLFHTQPAIFLIVTAILSLFVGSFLNVLIYRLPRMLEQAWNEECRIYLGLKPQQDTTKLNLWLPLSHCPRCKESIRPWHNIPLLSFIFLRGRCAYCHTPISSRYFWVEFLTCAASVFVAYQFGFTWQCAGALLFTWICIGLTFIDFDTHLLPDQLTLLLVWLGLLLSVFNIFCSPQDAIFGAIAGYAIFAIIQLIFGLFTGKTGMGQGDYKFLAGIGAFVGWQMLPLVVLISSITGVIFTLTHMVIKRDFRSNPLPFGPYLAMAGWIALLWGTDIMKLYLNSIYG
jgi:leader peptidase (prepilin peptidase)/N-methyltransferase